MPGHAKAFTDLQGAVASHFVTLRNANPGKDLTTLFTKETPTIRTASVSHKNDLNAAHAEYLLAND